jgi:Spy/CpxP family protein refolding chaperone
MLTLETTNMKTKNNITLIAAFVALVAFSTNSWAQPTDAKMEKKIEHRIEKMKSKLNLSDAQVVQVKTILEASKPQIKADIEKMKAAPKDQKDALRADLKKDKSAVKDKLFAILTPEQQVKAEKFFKSHEKEHDEEKK